MLQDADLLNNQAKYLLIGSYYYLVVVWSNPITFGEQNRAYRLLIDRIVYDREDNGVTLEVLYK